MATAILHRSDGQPDIRLEGVDLPGGLRIRARVIRRGLFGRRVYVRLEVKTPGGRNPFVCDPTEATITTERGPRFLAD